MNLSELTPDTALAALLDGKVEVQTKTDSWVVPVYAQAEQPTTGLSDEFISVQYNGTIRSLTRPLGIFRGNLALTIYCKVHDREQTAKRNRIASMVEQSVELVNGKVSQGFYFELDPSNVITPTTVNLTNGYATTVLNVEWHTTDEFHNKK